MIALEDLSSAVSITASALTASLTSAVSIATFIVSISASATAVSIPATSSDIAKRRAGLLFPVLTERAQDDDDDSNSTDSTAKSILEWIFLALVLSIVALIIIKRLYNVRQTSPSTSRFLSSSNSQNSRSLTRHTIPRTTGLPSSSTFGAHHLTAYDLANVPTAYSPPGSTYTYPYLYPGHTRHNTRRTRTRAVDIGEGGRRTGGGPSDYDGELDDKDVLPAYDKYGGPPGYVEIGVPGGGQAVFTMSTIGTGAGGVSDPVASPAGSPEIQVPEDSVSRELGGGNVVPQQRQMEGMERADNAHGEGNRTWT